MNEYFYYFGILYFLFSASKMWDSHKPKKEEEVLRINDKMDVAELMDTAQTYRANNKSNILKNVIALMFLIWSIVGYKSNCPEKYLFLSDIVFTLIQWATICYIGVHFAFKAFFNNKAQVHNDVRQPTYTINFSRISNIIEIIIVSAILFHHFFIR